ncbi:hypothetical protein [Paraferrimonas haliotis]|uniref:hypothetical protein n=1 Tax=Paraferrimonas haliotis TaxID=2013866 RepID=UPI000BA93606|nr:hypothetical protein [Paraferrimonas haliotis]
MKPETGAIVVGSGMSLPASITKSVAIEQSFLQASLSEVVAGHFTWHTADVTTLLGIVLSICGLGVAIWRGLKHER